MVTFLRDRSWPSTFASLRSKKKKLYLHFFFPYNASNNELVRTKTLVKNAIIQIDATPFRQWYENFYGDALGKAKDAEKKEKEGEAPKSVKAIRRKKFDQAAHKKDHELDPRIADQFAQGRLYACISSRPGQCGRVDGYVLEGKELDFYLKKMAKKR